MEAFYKYKTAQIRTSEIHMKFEKGPVWLIRSKINTIAIVTRT